MTIDIPEENSRIKTSKALLWLGIISIVMLFAGLTSAYIIRQAKGDWLVFDLPQPFYLSTIIIITSSVFLFLSYRAAQKDNFRGIILHLAVTSILGILFLISQVMGWNSMIEQGIFFTGPGSNVSASFLYAITFLHAGHVLGGIASLLVAFAKSLKKKYDSKKILGLQLCSTYWHFLGVLWLYLFVFLLLVR